MRLFLIATLAWAFPLFAIAQKNDTKPSVTPAGQKFISGTVLLQNKKAPDGKAILAALKSEWKIKVDSPSISDKTVVFNVPGATVMFAFLDYPIASAEIKAVSRITWLWPNAAEAATKHQAQLVVTVIGDDNRALSLYQLFTKVTSSVLNKTAAIGVYMNEQYVLAEKGFYLAAAQNMKDNQTIPVYLWVYFGMSDEGGKSSAYTNGMKEFGLQEMEILNSSRSMQEIHGVLYDAAIQVIRDNKQLVDGQTLKIDEEISLRARAGKSYFQQNAQAIRFEY